MEMRTTFLEKKIKEKQQKMARIQSQNEIVELGQVNEKIEALRKEVKHTLRHLQKPFLKLQSLVHSRSYNLFLDETKKLHEYLTDPFEALATEEEGCSMLKKILEKIDDAIVQKKLKLKKSRLRKAKDQIANILQKNTLLPLYESCKEIFSKRQQLSTLDTITESRNELAKVQKNLKNLQKRRELLNSRRRVLERRIKEAVEKIEQQKRELEEIILELTNQKVKVLLQTKLD
jgi:DNA repair exonuclease SbcCD ATPase subunit